MSVRRLAEDAVQPEGFAFSRDNLSWAKKTIRKYPKGREQSAVIPLMMRAQEQEGWLTRAAIESIAEMLAMPRIRALEVATFYTQFQLAPVGTKAHVQVCGTTPCMLRGAEDLIRVCKSKIGNTPHQPNADGSLSWEEVECLGACVNAPMVMIAKDSYEDLTAERLEEILDLFSAGRGDEVPVGPQNGRMTSAPLGGATTLTDEKVFTRARRSSKAENRRPAGVASVAKPAGTRKATSARTRLPSLDDKNRPEVVVRPEKPDDLKLISGVGPKIEGILHTLGIYTYKQIAAWTGKECDWVDGYLRFKGRIEREDWVEQAKVLARGGAEEYLRVFGKKPR